MITFAEHVARDGLVDVDDQPPIALFACTRQRQTHIQVLAAVQHEQKRDREDGDQLADEAERRHGDVPSAAPRGARGFLAAPARHAPAWL
jgi:hypothetical protein